MPTGRQFRIRSVLDGLYLVCDTGTSGEGSPKGQRRCRVRMRKVSDRELADTSRLDTLWYQDCLRSGVRSAIRTADLCLDFDKENGELYACAAVADKESQHLMVTGDVIRNQIDQTKVVAVNGEEVLEGDGLAMCEYAIGDITQKFEFIYAEARYFRIRCDNNKVLDCADDRHVFITQHTKSDRQLFYMDKHSTICSKVDDRVLDSSDKKITLCYFEAGKPEHLWTFSADRIVNSTRPSKVLTVKGTKHEEGASLVSTKFNGDSSQKWSLEYVD